MSQNLDEIDVKILKMLLRDARTSFSDISKACGVSTTIIQRRFDALRNSGIIVGTSLTVNPKPGFNFSLIVELKVDTEQIQSVIKALKEIPHLRNVYPIAGKFDIHAIYVINSVMESDEIRNVLSSINGIKKIKLLLVDRTFASNVENLELTKEVH